MPRVYVFPFVSIFVRVGLSLIAWVPVALAQQDPHEQLLSAYALEQKGEYDSAILTAHSVMASSQLSEAERGRAWILLGFAYKEQGRLQEAQQSFESALAIFRNNPRYALDYAAALNHIGGLYRATGDLVAAQKIWEEAAEIDTAQGDHEALLGLYTNLSELELDLNHLRVSKEYLDHARMEAKSADTSDDAKAALAVTKASVASAEGSKLETVRYYSEALQAWQHGHGEAHPLTGWGHLLLGSAYAKDDDLADALASINKGLSILEHSVGTTDPKYLLGQIEYSRVLDQAGQHAEAAGIRGTAERAMREMYRGQCPGCVRDIEAFR
jgi:tetratricopeptide (TPR) repeat protein